MAIEADICDERAVNAIIANVVDQWGAIHILINNAGISTRRRSEELSEEEWLKALDTNLTSALLYSKSCYSIMKEAGGEKILNNGSMLSLFGSTKGAPYGSLKGGIMQMTRSHATAWAQDNIQVNCYLPGWINTDLTVKAREDAPGLYGKVLARTPAGR